MQIHPEKRERQSPPKKSWIAFGALENQQPQARQQERKNLRPNSPDRHGGPRSAEHGHARNVGARTAAQIQQEECLTKDRGKEDDQSSPSNGVLELVEQQFREPFMCDPGLSGASVRK